MASWPLPDRRFITEGLTYVPFDTTVAIDPEAGSPLTRNRYTGEMVDIAGPVEMFRSECVTLYHFWRDDLARGSLRFDWTDPMTDEAVEFLFMRAPQFAPSRARWWRATVALRRMP